MLHPRSFSSCYSSLDLTYSFLGSEESETKKKRLESILKRLESTVDVIDLRYEGIFLVANIYKYSVLKYFESSHWTKRSRSYCESFKAEFNWYVLYIYEYNICTNIVLIFDVVTPLRPITKLYLESMYLFIYFLLCFY